MISDEVNLTDDIKITKLLLLHGKISKVMADKSDSVLYRELVSRLLRMSVLDGAKRNMVSTDTLLYKDYLNHNNYTSKEWYVSEYIKQGINAKLGIPYNEFILLPIADVEMLLDVAMRYNNVEQGV